MGSCVSENQIVVNWLQWAAERTKQRKYYSSFTLLHGATQCIVLFGWQKLGEKYLTGEFDALLYQSFHRPWSKNKPCCLWSNYFQMASPLQSYPGNSSPYLLVNCDSCDMNRVRRSQKARSLNPKIYCSEINTDQNYYFWLKNLRFLVSTTD